MFWSRNFKEFSEDGVAMPAGVVVVEAEDMTEARGKILEIEKSWDDNSYCAGPVMGLYKTKKAAEESKMPDTFL